VYKLVAVEENGEIVPKIKISNNVNKITTPGFKQVYRFYDKRNNKAMADVITLYDEKIPEKGPYEIFHPLFTWKRKLLNNYYVRPLLVQIYDKGKCVYQSPNIHEIRKYCFDQLDTLWDEVKRFERPHEYFVDLSEALWNVKDELLKKHK
jgi:nicotinate phosphoribosyltransferase